MATSQVDIETLLERHRDKFRRIVEVILAEEAGEDPFRVTLERFRGLSDEERALLVQRAATIAWERVSRELRARRAAWLVLVGDDVVQASGDRTAIPDPEEVLRLGEPRGLVAYLFLDEMIEEVTPFRSSWAPIGSSDRYPTVPVALSTASGAMRPAADLDTGSPATFVDARLVGAAPPSWFAGRHLGATFRCAPTGVDIEVATRTGAVVRRTVRVLQVGDWDASPFVRVNPTRQMLVGRDLLRAFGLEVSLRFSSSRTEVERSDG